MVTQRPKVTRKVRVHYPDNSYATIQIVGNQFSSSQLNNIKSNLEKYCYVNDIIKNLSSIKFDRYLNLLPIKAKLKANPIGYINDNGQWVDEQTDTHLTLKQLDPQSQISVGEPDKLSATNQDMTPIVIKTNQEDQNDQSTVDPNLGNQFASININGLTAQLKPNQQVYIDDNWAASDPQTHKEIGS